MEKQIEETAKEKNSKQWQRRDEYCLRIQKATQYKGDCDHEDVPSILVDYEKEIKKELIPENAVVLTEAEYNDLLSDEIKTIERDIAEYWATENVDVVAKEMHKIGYRKLDDHAICVLRKAKCLEERLRKETAEELLDEIDYESNGQTKPITDLFRKKYGV